MEQTIIHKEFELKTPSGAILRGTARWNASQGDRRRPVVIICHGFKAFKDWGPFPQIGTWFAAHGFASIVFNFSHNGIGVEPRKFTEHALFEKNTISLEIEDVRTILSALEEGNMPGAVYDMERIALIGHSRGGGIALITAREERRVHAAVLWSSVSTFNRYTPEQIERWREKGYIQLHSISATKTFRITTDLLDDVERNRERFDLMSAAAHLAKPLLIVHGTEDIPVKIGEAERLYDVADKTMTQFVKLEGANHMYGAKHPYRHESPTLTHVLEVTGSWLHSVLHGE
ncbi:MAG: alpha/beta hydrolase family protein [Acidobacteriota bacterium]